MKYPGRLDGALLNSAEMDRWILAGATAAEFEAMARDSKVVSPTR